MKCSACREQLGAYFDGDLKPGARLAVAGHVAACAACSEFALQLRAVDARLAGLRSVEPHAGFTAAVLAKIAALPQAQRAWLSQAWWIAGYVGAAWAIVAVALATRTIAWQTALAAAGAFLGKAGVSLETLLRVAVHFHLGGLAALGAGVEIALLAVLAIVGRTYLWRLGHAPLGARW